MPNSTMKGERWAITLIGIAIALAGLVIRLFDLAKDFFVWGIFSFNTFLLILGLLIVAFYVPLAIFLHIIVKRKKPKPILWPQGSIYITLVIIIIICFPIFTSIGKQATSDTFEELTKDHIIWLLDNKSFSSQISDDINHLNLFTKQVGQFKSHYVKKTAEIIQGTFRALGSHDKETDAFNEAFSLYCRTGSPVGLSESDLKSEEIPKHFSYYLSTKGLIGRALANEGENPGKVDFAMRCFENAIGYNNRCKVALNGLGVTLFYKLQQHDKLDDYAITTARRSEDFFIKTVDPEEKTVDPEEGTYFISNYSKARNKNNIVCIDLNIINKILHSGHLQTNPGIKEFAATLDRKNKVYFNKFVLSIENVFSVNYEHLIEAQKKCSTEAKIHHTFAQFYSMLAEYLFTYHKEKEQDIELACNVILGREGPSSFRGLLNESIARLKTAHLSGIQNFYSYLTKEDENLRKYGFGAFVLAREKGSEDIYRKFLCVTGLIDQIR